MRRVLLTALVLLSAMPAAAHQRPHVGRPGPARLAAAAPPPPVIAARADRRVSRVLASDVHRVDDQDFEHDAFRFGRWWYVHHAGFWYRGAALEGPLEPLDARLVPQPVLEVPERHWRHSRPAGVDARRARPGAEGTRHARGRERCCR